MKKTVAFKRPSSPVQEDAWVGAGADNSAPVTPSGPMKRLTIDIPLELHRQVKRECADRGIKMADIVRDLLAKEFLS